uniref:PIN domain-containing protein n=1 Tax=Schlesneria paludicola TaxID=360056 RepID=A0A7C2NZ99_9PLAN
MKVLLDLNVVLDVVLNRQPWIAESAAVWNAHHSGAYDGFLAATELTNLFYIVRRLAGESTARSAVRSCLATFDMVPVDRSVLFRADQQTGIDFEDNVAIACEVAAGIDLIVTRDPAGFAHSPVPAVSPADLLARIAPTNP